MVQSLFATHADPIATVLRLALGLMILPHGAQKLLGWFGGHGPKGTLAYFRNQLGIPTAFGALAIAAEFFGGLGLVLGVLGRVAAFGVGVTLLVASFQHFRNGFFMNWSGRQRGEGWEFHVLALAIAVTVIVLGSGAWSVDAVIASHAGLLATR